MSVIGERSFLRKFFTNYRSRALRKSVVWDLSFEQFAAICSLPCAYCGAEPQQKTWLWGEKSRPKQYTHYKSKEALNGIDRIKNDEGYIIGNVAPCCGICNSMKSSLSVAEFLARIELILAHTRGLR